MHKILITGSIHEIGLELLRREKDFEIRYAPELPYQETVSYTHLTLPTNREV